MNNNRESLLLLKFRRLKCIGAGFMFFCLMLLPQGAIAGTEIPKLLGSPEKVSATIVAPVAIMHDMLGERLIVEVMPAYWTASFDGVDATGYGGALALKYELTSNWGVALVGSYGSSNELSTTRSFLLDMVKSSKLDLGQFISGKYKIDYSETVALALTYDPFSEPGGFRLPIFFGSASKKAKMSGLEKWTKDTITVVNQVPDGLKFMFGISPEFNIWKLRFEAGLVAILSQNSTFTAKRANVTDLGDGSYGYGSADFLLGVKYTPLGVTYNFQYDGAAKLTVYSLTFSKNW